ncbi:MAG: Crp/Fnr family transcriptional regulator [Thermoleophilia bacterium]
MSDVIEAGALPALVPGLIRLSRVNVFAGLPDDALAVLDRRLPVVRWTYGFPPPPELRRRDHLFVVREGRLAVFERTLSGHDVIIALLEAGAVYSSLGDCLPPRVDAIEDAAVSPVAASALEALIARHPRLGRNLAEVFTERIGMLREVSVVLGEMRVEDRLRARLRQLAGRIGRTRREGVVIPVELTHSQWALLVGASREAVTIAFGRMRGRGEVTVEGRQVTVAWSLLEEPAGAERPVPAEPAAGP